MSNSLIESLPRMNQKELLDLKARISFLLVGKGSSDSNPGPEVLGIIVGYLQDHGLDNRSVKVLQKTGAYPAFEEKVNYISTKFCKKLDRKERRRFFQLSVDLLAERIQDQKLEVTASALMNHFHRVPGIIDQNFPGYLTSGLIQMLVNRQVA